MGTYSLKGGQGCRGGERVFHHPSSLCEEVHVYSDMISVDILVILSEVYPVMTGYVRA